MNTGRRSPPVPLSPAPRGSGAASSIRIIGGRWRGTRLPIAERPGLRPTSDRVRETLFNWLQAHLAGARVLDLFAGSGALGLEALSRGAASAQLVEADPKLALHLRELGGRLGAGGQLEIHAGDALAWLQGAHARMFDIAFVDPPFDNDLWAAVLEMLPARMAGQAWIYVESPADLTPVLPMEWALHREGSTRLVRYALYRRG
ncbi:MAG: 16S rRNA (guanine(966)-N(2))-methyltransferase RsmD [Pseudomonadota bacterium]|nr:16S rRNA (guanine(966)-N(2))-methyltransferase RsmD [Pseudomonadota bacterium]